MSGGVEIERKFLVTEVPDWKPLRELRLLQGYIATGETEVRLRSDGSCRTLTCKRGEGLARLETEIELSSGQFEELWPLTENRRIEKTRYHFDHQGHLIEVDVYHGKLEPLIVAEVEFDSEEGARAFVPPPFLGKEVTEDSRYKNRNLAMKGVP